MLSGLRFRVAGIHFNNNKKRFVIFAIHVLRNPYLLNFWQRYFFHLTIKHTLLSIVKSLNR